MHQIWDQDHRDREVCEDAVRTLDQGQETELGDGEIYNAANQGCKDLVAEIFLLGVSPVFFTDSPAKTVFFLSAHPASIPLQILLTIAATILTAVETAPRIIRTEISGVINAFPTPF